MAGTDRVAEAAGQPIPPTASARRSRPASTSRPRRMRPTPTTPCCCSPTDSSAPAATAGRDWRTASPAVVAGKGRGRGLGPRRRWPDPRPPSAPVGLPAIDGAVGAWDFDKTSGIELVSSTYEHWRVEGSSFAVGPVPVHRLASPTRDGRRLRSRRRRLRPTRPRPTWAAPTSRGRRPGNGRCWSPRPTAGTTTATRPTCSPSTSACGPTGCRPTTSSSSAPTTCPRIPATPIRGSVPYSVGGPNLAQQRAGGLPAAGHDRIPAAGHPLRPGLAREPEGHQERSGRRRLRLPVGSRQPAGPLSRPGRPRSLRPQLVLDRHPRTPWTRRSRP